MYLEICRVCDEKLAVGLLIYFCASFAFQRWEKTQQDRMLSGKRIHRMHWGTDPCPLFISSERREIDYSPKVHLLSRQFSTPGSYFHRNNLALWSAFCITKGFNELNLETKLPFVKRFLRKNVFCFVARRKVIQRTNKQYFLEKEVL